MTSERERLARTGTLNGKMERIGYMKVLKINSVFPQIPFLDGPKNFAMLIDILDYYRDEVFERLK